MNHPCAVRPLALVILLLVILPGLAAPPSADAQLNVTGQWSTMSSLAPVQPVHVALLRTGKVLMVEGSSNDSAQHAQQLYRYTIWNPATGAFSTGTTPWDLFCNSMSFFPDGRLLISGGNLSYNPFSGLKTTTIFDPATEKFIQVEDTAKGRWYPTTVTLQDGGVMSFSGLDENAVPNPDTEIYDIGFGWAGPYTAPFEPKYYPRLHLLNDGKVLMTGPDPGTRTFDPQTGTWSPATLSHPYNGSRMYGSSVMLPLKPSDGYAMRILAAGGDTSGATNQVHILDTSLSTWSWRQLASLDQPRVTQNAVILPNGKVLVVGGSAQFNVASTAAMNALLFNPATETWSPAGTIAFPRMYHSTAILLPDATVWLGGSNPTEGVWTPQMEIYKPPYLFTSTGAPAARPTISSSPGVVGYGASFTVNTPDAANISQVVLARNGSVTHAFDMDQRLIEMNFTKGAGTLTVTSPPSATVAPPGYYMLFVLNSSGVPSVAQFIRIAQNPGNQPPVATITNPATSSVNIQPGQSVTFAGSASDPDGTVTKYQWLFPNGTPAKSAAQNPGAVVFPTAGTYTVSLTVLDNLGDNNVSPPTVTVNVGGAAVLGAAITSPATGATVSGSAVPVSMSASNVQGSPTSFVLKVDNGATIFSQSVTGTTASTTWNTTGLTNGAHTLNLTVTDGAGRTATATSSVTVNNTTGGGGGGGDTTPPTVSITSPTGNVWTGNSIGFSVTASDNVGLVSIKLWGNGAVFATVNCSGTTCSGDTGWLTGPLPPAAYQVHAVALDTGGNQTLSSPVTIFKDATSPLVPSGATAGGGGGTTPPPLGAAISAPANGATVSGTAVPVSMSASNAQGSPTSFVLKVDNGATIFSQSGASSTATTSWNTSGVSNGTHTLNLTVTDGAGRTATATTTVTVNNTTGGGGGGDTTPPTVSITSPTGNVWTGNSIGFSVTASDNVGLVSIKLWGNGAVFATVTCSGTTCSGNTGWVTGPLPPAAYQVHAVALDTAGNQTLSSPVTIFKDATSPLIPSGASAGGGGGTTPPPALGAAITAPANGATVSGSAVPVSMSASNAQGSPTSFVLKVDNGATIFSQSVAGATTSTTWNTTGLTNGAHTLNLTVTDAAGRTASATVSVTVSNTTTPPPALGAAITAPASGATVSGSAVPVSMSASNAQGSPTSFVLKVDNGATIFSQSVAGATASTTWNTTGLTNGAHTLNLTVTDSAGRTATATTSVTVNNTTGGGGGGGDTTPPTVSITSPTGNVWTGNSIGFSVTASDNVGLVSIKLWGNGAVFATVTCSGTTCSGNTGWVTGPLPPAAYQVHAVALDTAGNQTLSSPVTIFKDATSPLIPSGASGGGGTPPPPSPLGAAITAPANGATVSGTSVGVTMTASNAQGTSTSFALSVDNGATIFNQSVAGSSATTTWNTTGVSNGAHTLNLTVTDGAGRTATAAITVTVSNTTGGGGGGDTTAPSVAITNPPSGAWTGNSLDITVSGSDNVGLTNIQVFGNGALVDTLTCGGSATCSGVVWWSTGPLPSGQHTVSAVSTDTAGNKSSTASIVINK